MVLPWSLAWHILWGSTFSHLNLDMWFISGGTAEVGTILGNLYLIHF